MDLAPPAAFELVGPTSTESGHKVLGIWTTLPTASLVFATAARDESLPLFRANLPADPAQARTSLAQADEGLRRVRVGLALVPERLEGLVNACDATGFASLGAPEAELVRLLRDMRLPDISFGSSDMVLDGWRETLRDLELVGNLVAGGLGKDVLIETTVDGTRLSLTKILPLGSQRSVWRDRIALEEVELHRRAVFLALESRVLLGRYLSVGLNCAMKLSILGSGPINPLAVLAAV